MATELTTGDGRKTLPLRDEHRALCGALDRLLTIGSYYTSAHERFRAVALECHTALQKSLGQRPHLEILIEAEGLGLDHGLLPAASPEGRRLFELLDSLQVALLELDARTTAEDLSRALAALRQARQGLSARRSYGEIEIDGLPDTVRVTSRALFLRTRGRENQARARSADPGDTLFLDPHLVSEQLLAASPRGRKCEQEFVGIIQGILATTDPLRLVRDSDAPGRPEDWLSDETVAAIDQVLQALAGSGSDLMNLRHLIGQAQSALRMTGDPQLVELVFARLQKNAGQLARRETRARVRNAGHGSAPGRSERNRQPSLSVQQMRQIVAELPVSWGPAEDPAAQAAADGLAVCLQVLDQAPAPEIGAGAQEAITAWLSVQPLSRPVRALVVRALHALLNERNAADIGAVWPLVWGPLRVAHAPLLESIWLELWQSLSSRGREKAWPYLVNDLLLGLPRTDLLQRLLLLEGLSQVDALENHEARAVLENLPALREWTICADFFDAPPPLLYPVHKVLVGGSRSGRFGPLLHASLVRQAPHKLTALLLEVMDGYDPLLRPVYHALLDQGVQEELLPELAELAPELIAATLDDLHWDFMDEPWVAEAIACLGRLGREPALRTLDEIINERKFLVFRGWPSAARSAARQARAELREKLDYRRQREQEREHEHAGPEPAGK